MTLKTMYITLASVRLSFLVFVCVSLYTCSAVAIENQLLKTMQSFDDVYEKGVSSSGNHIESYPSRYRTENDIVDEEWVFTQSGCQKAVLKTQRLVPQRISADEAKPFPCTVFLSDMKRLGVKSADLLPGVPFQEYADSQNVRFASLNLYDPDSDTLSYRLGLFLVAMGRGITKNIDVVETVDKSTEWNGEECVLIIGQIVGHGKGYFGAPGVWRIHALPDAAYMIRHAQFLYDGVVFIEVETFGLNCKDDCFYPEKSEIKDIGDARFKTFHKFEFYDARLKFDSDFFEKVSQYFDAEMPKSSLIKDFSPGEPKVRLIGGEKPHEPYIIESRPIFWRVIALVAVAVVIDIILVVLLFYLIYRHRLKKIESP